jgi:hypothetical protein
VGLCLAAIIKGCWQINVFKSPSTFLIMKSKTILALICIHQVALGATFHIPGDDEPSLSARAPNIGTNILGKLGRHPFLKSSNWATERAFAGLGDDQKLEALKAKAQKIAEALEGKSCKLLENLHVIYMLKVTRTLHKSKP